MEEGERQKEETKYAHPPLSPREPHTWPMITYGEEGSERHMIYNIKEDHNYVRIVHELKNKHVACCYGEWLVLTNKSTDDCSILNILTMEKLQLPSLIPRFDCVISSPTMDRSCRIIFIERDLFFFWSCHLGDSEFIARDLTYRDEIISDHINFKGKLYAVTTPGLNLIAFDFSDPDFRHEHVISGESIPESIFLTICETFGENKVYLVESCDDLLLICIGSYSREVSDVQVFKADFSTGEWEKLETLGDRTIFLGLHNSTFSPAGMKGGAIYWVTTPFHRSPCKRHQTPRNRHLYMYNIEDKSISMSLLFPILKTYKSLSRVSFPMTWNEDKRSEQMDRVSLFDQREINKTEETVTIGSTMVWKESLWADLPNGLLLEIFLHLFAGDSVAFISVCRSWYSVSPPLVTSQQFVLPLRNLDFSVPLLVCSYNKAYDPIHGKLYSMDFSDILGAKVRAARDGWLLMDYYLTELFFFNPLTKAKMYLPDCNVWFYYSVFFSTLPTSADCLVVLAARRWDSSHDTIYYKKREDDSWTFIELFSVHFNFSYCNPVVYKGLYYFIGLDGDLLIFNPEKIDAHVIEAPKFFRELKDQIEHEYMLEIDGKLIAVFVGAAGSSVHICEWNVSTNKWEILGSLGNLMLFVSRPLSLCKRATVRGTGNKIYFPRVVGDEGQILFYSLATKMYHTFEMGTSYSNFSASKFYPEYNGWFMP